MTPALESAYAQAERVTAHWARSFHFASRFLPVEKKRAIFALYDYCRHADNLVDTRRDGKNIYYSLSRPDVRQIIGALHDAFCDPRRKR